jgi:exopolyphosphatase / guanosine-5'-triphosphate,3'-diphosphate pyrophosphatase
VDGRTVRRVAAIDCGTNSVRLLVVEDGTDLHRETRIVRLGQAVDRTGVLAPDAIERTRAALADYAAVIDRLGVEQTRMVATSATRDAGNRKDFVDMVHATLGAEPEVVTGLEEAELSYSGAVGTLRGVSEPVLLIDLGGGSTELVLGGEPLRAHSMDIGSVRMTERHLIDDPPTADQVAAAVHDVQLALDAARADVPIDEASSVVGVAGTVTTLAAIVLGLDKYDSDVIHGSRIPTAAIADVTERLLQMNPAERAAIRVIHPGRVDVIAGGALVLRTVLERTGAAAVIASENDILDGIAASIS